MKIKELEEKIRVCRLCRLAEGRKNAVPGEGSPNAKIMLVGEAPGRSEDEQGRPFVGAAGRLLDEALRNGGIDRKDIYITNIVKCRPPNNRVPLKDEIDTCMPYLEMQIKLIEPSIICILGRTAYQRLLNGRSITTTRGKLVVNKGRSYFITIHPAAALYNPSLKELFFKDIEELGKMVKELESKRLEWYL